MLFIREGQTGYPEVTLEIVSGKIMQQDVSDEVKSLQEWSYQAGHESHHLPQHWHHWIGSRQLNARLRAAEERLLNHEHVYTDEHLEPVTEV